MILGRPRKVALLIALTLLPVPLAHAAEPGSPPATPEAPKPTDDSPKAEAARRFERGIRLFNSGDNSGALAEFKRIYEIVPNPVVLYNIGLVYAAMARPVDAVDALEPAMKSGVLSPKDLERAEQTYLDQKARVARLSVSTTPEGARIEIDGVEVAKTPLSAPIRIAEGSHVVGAVAEGFATTRKELVVAGNTDATLHLDLVAARGKQLANLSVRSATVAAEVRVDGQRAGVTPLAASITLAPGHHVVELTRPGYRTARREVDLGEGATSELALDLGVDPAALGAEGAYLVIESTASPVQLRVNGRSSGVYTAPLRLPRGPHHVSVTAAGFIPAERDVSLDPSVTNVVRFVLEPTPETREAYRSNALFHRTWGWVGVIGGAVIGGGGATLVVLGSSQKKDGEAALTAVDQKLQDSVPPCDYKSGFAAEADGTSYECDKARSDAQGTINSGKTKTTIGFVGIGVGAAVAVTGVVLLLTGDDPDKYEHHASRSGARRLALLPGPGDIGAALAASF